MKKVTGRKSPIMYQDCTGEISQSIHYTFIAVLSSSYKWNVLKSKEITKKAHKTIAIINVIIQVFIFFLHIFSTKSFFHLLLYTVEM